MFTRFHRNYILDRFRTTVAAASTGEISTTFCFNLRLRPYIYDLIVCLGLSLFLSRSFSSLLLPSIQNPVRIRSSEYGSVVRVNWSLIISPHYTSRTIVTQVLTLLLLSSKRIKGEGTLHDYNTNLGVFFTVSLVIFTPNG